MTQSSSKVISGQVSTASGRAVSDARIFIIGGPTSFSDIAVLSDSNGRFSLTAPAEGNYTLSCNAEGFAPVTVEASVPLKEPLRIELIGLG